MWRNDRYIIIITLNIWNNVDRKIKIFFFFFFDDKEFDFIREREIDSEIINWVKKFDELFLKNENFVLDDEWREQIK